MWEAIGFLTKKGLKTGPSRRHVCAHRDGEAGPHGPAQGSTALPWMRPREHGERGNDTHTSKLHELRLSGIEKMLVVKPHPNEKHRPAHKLQTRFEEK